MRGKYVDSITNGARRIKDQYNFRDALTIVSLRFATRMMKTTHGGVGTNVAEAF